MEIGAGDGVVGSHTLGLELNHQWSGSLWEPCKRPRQKARQARRCRVPDVEEAWLGAGPIDLLAIHRPREFPEIWNAFQIDRSRPGWVIVENPHPEDHWARILEGVGYKLRFFFHDDEYYELQNKRLWPKRGTQERVFIRRPIPDDRRPKIHEDRLP